MEQHRRVLLQPDEVQKTISRMAHEILEKGGGVGDLALIGILSRGAHLVERIARQIEKLVGTAPAVGVVDISPYRDDVDKSRRPPDTVSNGPVVSVDEKTVVLVDDVIYTGRTVRAALNLISQLGRPRKVLVAIMIDRGQRELPLKADIVGKNVRVQESERVNVLLRESDGTDQVVVAQHNWTQPPARRYP